MPEIDVGSIVMRIRADASGIQEGAKQFSDSLAKMSEEERRLQPSMERLERNIALTSARYKQASRAVMDATVHFERMVALHGKESDEAQKAERALLRRTEALSRANSAMARAVAEAEKVSKANQDIESTAERAGKAQEEMSAAAVAGYAAATAAAVKLFNAVVSAIETGIEAMNRYRAALIGLGSVASGRGITGDEMTGALDGLTDAFLDAGSAATALKNLLSRGYTLSEAITAITQLKDAAAFGRQGQLTLAQAVVTATEGVRNQNSILVDNAGVTKNLSIMHKEYAASIGTTVAALTDQQKIQAEIAGFTRETAHQTGDLAKLQNTLAGAQAETAMTGERLARAYGEAMSPSVQLVTEALGGFLGTLENITKTFPGTTAGITGFTLAMTGMTVVTKGVQALKALNASLQAAAGGVTLFGTAIKVSLPLLAGISLAIGAVTALWTAHSKAIERAREEEEKKREAERQRLKELEQSTKNLKEMTARYEELSVKQHRTLSETQELADIQGRLATQFGISTEAIDKQGASYKTTADAARELTREQLKQLQASKDAKAQESRTKFQESDLGRNLAERRALEEILQLEERRLDLERRFEALAARPERTSAVVEEMAELADELTNVNVRLYELAEASNQANMRIITNVGEIADRAKQALKSDTFNAPRGDDGAFSEWIEAEMDAAANAAEAAGTEINAKVKAVLDGIFKEFAESQKASPDFDMSGLMHAYASALASADLGPALRSMEELNKKLLSGAQIQDAEIPALQTYWDKIVEYAQKATHDMGQGTGFMEAMLSRLAPAFSPVIHNVESMSDAVKALQSAVRESRVGELIGGDADAAKAAFAEITKASNDAMNEIRSIGRTSTQQNATIDALNILKDSMSGMANVTEEMVKKATDSLTQMGVAVPSTIAEAEASINNFIAQQRSTATEFTLLYKSMTEQISLYKDALEGLEGTGEGDSQQAENLKALIGQLEEVMKYADQLRDKGLELDTSKAQSAIDALDMSRFEAGLESAEEASKRLQGVLDKTTAEANRLNKEMAQKTGLAEKYQSILKVAQAQEQGRASAQEWAQAQADAAKYLGYIGDSASEMGNLASIALQNIQAELQKLGVDASTAASMVAKITQVAASTPSLNLNVSPAISAINSLSRVWDAFANSFLGKLFGLRPIGTVSSGGGGSRGGGGSSRGDSPFAKEMKALEHDIKMGRVGIEQELNKLNAIFNKYRTATGKSALTEDERRDIQERIYAVQKEIRERSLDSAYDNIEYRKSMNQMSIAQEIEALEQIAKAHKLSNEERKELDVRLHEARKRLRDEQYQWDIALLDHNKAMGRLTVDEEIASLERIKAAHNLSVEELRTIEERLYSLREGLRKDNENKEQEYIKRAYRAITEATKNRLSAERDAELKILDERMAALDKLTQAENEQQRRADYEASLAEKQRALSVTKSARERRQLAAEIAKMEEAEALRQRQLSRQDEKDAINEEKRLVQERYKELTSEENIRQEALRLVMSSNLSKMTDLIASYGNQWQDAGASLAEHLTTGIEAGKERVAQTLAALTQSMDEAVKRQMTAIGSAIPAMGGNESIQIIMNGLTIREEADIRKLASAMNTELQRARR